MATLLCFSFESAFTLASRCPSLPTASVKQMMSLNKGAVEIALSKPHQNISGGSSPPSASRLFTASMKSEGSVVRVAGPQPGSLKGTRMYEEGEAPEKRTKNVW